MAGGFCSRCGSPVVLGSQYCPKCGAPLVGTPITAQTTPPHYSSPGNQARSPPARSSAAVGIVVAVVLVVGLLLLFLVLEGYLGSSGSSPSGGGGGGGGGTPVVTVTAINIVSSSNPCGVNGHTFNGYTTEAGGSEQDTLTINNGALLFSCTIDSVSATTSGFSISGANVPLTIPAGGAESLSFSIGAPSTEYTGVLTLDIE
jgi:hypothetical protein